MKMDLLRNELRKSPALYRAILEHENEGLRLENLFLG
jgi:hypothetical protein